MLTGKYDVHYVIFELSYPVARQRDYKRGLLGKASSFVVPSCHPSMTIPSYLLSQSGELNHNHLHNPRTNIPRIS